MNTTPPRNVVYYNDGSNPIPLAEISGLPYISEFSPSGQLLFNAELPAGLTSYRAYRLPWHPAG